MADTLSQTEIDALLNAFSTGTLDDIEEAPPEARVKEYDFRTANRFSKDQMKTLNIVYDYFSRSFTNYLSSTLRTLCNVTVVSVEETKYQEFVNSLPTPVVLAIYSMVPLAGPTLLELSPDVCYAVISRMLGGGVKGHSEIERTRTYTEIELVLLERILRQFTGLISEAWKKVTPVDATLDRVESSAQFAQIVSLNETVAIITLNCEIGDSSGLINFCIPQIALEPIIKKMTTQMWYSSEGPEKSALLPAIQDISNRIGQTLLPVIASFNDTLSTMKDVLNLQVDDVIILDHRVEQPLTVSVGPLPKFHAKIGVREKKYAVKITEMIREEETDND